MDVVRKTVSTLFALILVVSLLVSPSTYAVGNQDEEVKFAKQQVTSLEAASSKDYTNEQEPNDSFEQANEIPPLDAKYIGTFTDHDEDFYKLEVS